MPEPAIREEPPMDHNRRTLDPQEFIHDVEARQRNILWPDALRNARSVDRLIFRGAPDAPLVQRIGIILFGLIYVCGGLVFLGFARAERSFWFSLFSLGWILLGIVVCRNGLKRHKAHGAPRKPHSE
jgi:hypothetical protein